MARKLSDGKSDGGNFLKATDVPNGGELQLTIDSVVEEQLQRDDGTSHDKFVCYFKDKTKGLCLNNTNIDVLIDAYGDDIDAMAGKPIILFRTTCSFKGQVVPALRLRKPTEEVDSESVVF